MKIMIKENHQTLIGLSVCWQCFSDAAPHCSWSVELYPWNIRSTGCKRSSKHWFVCKNNLSFVFSLSVGCSNSWKRRQQSPTSQSARYLHLRARPSTAAWSRSSTMKTGWVEQAVWAEFRRSRVQCCFSWRLSVLHVHSPGLIHGKGCQHTQGWSICSPRPLSKARLWPSRISQ